MSTSIINGIFPPRHTWNGRIYSEEEYGKEVGEYLDKMILEERIKKLKKINEKIKNRA